MDKNKLEEIKQKALENHIPIIMDDTLEVIEKELKRIGIPYAELFKTDYINPMLERYKYKNLDERMYECNRCYSKLDRDFNASVNIMFEGLKLHIMAPMKNLSTR